MMVWRRNRDLAGDKDRILRLVRHRTVPARSADHDVEGVERGQDGAGSGGDRASREVDHAGLDGNIVETEHSVDRKTLEESVADQRGRTSPALLGRLEDQHHPAPRRRMISEVASRAQEHGRVGVVPAGVHDAGMLGPRLGVGRFLDRQRVHVRPQSDAPARRRTPRSLRPRCRRGPCAPPSPHEARRSATKRAVLCSVNASSGILCR